MKRKVFVAVRTRMERGAGDDARTRTVHSDSAMRADGAQLVGTFAGARGAAALAGAFGGDAALGRKGDQRQVRSVPGAGNSGG